MLAIRLLIFLFLYFQKIKNDDNSQGKITRSRLRRQSKLKNTVEHPCRPDDSADTDHDFTPTIEMLVHEFDDEATLDEEEEIEPADSQLLELQDLQRVLIHYHATIVTLRITILTRVILDV